ncbi:hypothetical protein L484_027344 [Morus notabilis]|uniref:Uncharacterized protein n=1 Tax=Morus notabilis TaxID=981085 RepID=W9QUU3_9ROSA|nr:hypothetical protein L484_027344 [Morus notabilis]
MMLLSPPPSVSSLSLERHRRRDARDREDLPMPRLFHIPNLKNIAPTLIGGCRKLSDLIGKSKLNVELVVGANVPKLQWQSPSEDATTGEEEKIFE